MLKFYVFVLASLVLVVSSQQDDILATINDLGKHLGEIIPPAEGPPPRPPSYKGTVFSF